MHIILRLPGCLTLCFMQSKCGTSCEGCDKDSPIRFQRVETGKKRQKTIDDLKKCRQKLSAFRKGYSKICTAKTFFRPPKLRAKSPPMMSWQLYSRLCRPRPQYSLKVYAGAVGNLDLSGTWSIWGFLIGEFLLRKSNRGPGQSGTWVCRKVGIGFTIGDLGHGCKSRGGYRGYSPSKNFSE